MTNGYVPDGADLLFSRASEALSTCLYSVYRSVYCRRLSTAAVA